MTAPSLASLNDALRADALEGWLAAVPDEAGRQLLRRALILDRRLWRAHPDSLHSCLLARSFGIASLAPLHQGWIEELQAGSRPWIRPLRRIPVPDGLLDQLHPDALLPFGDKTQLRFVDEDTVLLCEPSGRGGARRERLRWSWRLGEAVLESDPIEGTDHPRIETRPWEPALLVREPGQEPVVLPCPKESSVEARLLPGGQIVLVYGGHGAVEGGFVWFVEVDTLAIRWRHEATSPVLEVWAEAPEGPVVARTHDGFEAWVGGQHRRLSHLGRAGALDPSGQHLVTLSDEGVLQLWELQQMRIGSPEPAGFPARFDPSGQRLLCGRRVHDGRTGQPLYEIHASSGDTAAARPWFHLGQRHLISLRGGLQVWDTQGGTSLLVGDRVRLPQWYVVAYDREGVRLAALRVGDTVVVIRSIPDAAVCAELRFDTPGRAIAMSPDASLVAVAEGATVEVRSVADGARVLTLSHPVPGGLRSGSANDSLRFSADGRSLASFLEPDGWRIWSVEGHLEGHRPQPGGLEQVAGFATLFPQGWSIEGRSATVFHHHDSDARIVLPVSGPWRSNPALPGCVASDHLHAELCAP